MSSTGPLRTLTEMLRRFDDAEVADLLLQRPDLASPRPRTFSDLAARATTRHSVGCAVDLLTAFELYVAHRVVTVPAPFRVAEAISVRADGQRASAAEVADAISRLRRLALVWGPAAGPFRPVRALRSVLADSGQDATPESLEAASPTPPPVVEEGRQSPELVAKVAAGSCFELVRRMNVLLEHCAVQPILLRRDGSVAVREASSLAQLLDVQVKTAAWYIGLAEAAGLLGASRSDGAELLYPAEAFAGWQQLSLARQWAMLVDAWSADPQAASPQWLKQLCLAAFGDPADGRALARASVRDWVLWHRPRCSAVIRRQTDAVLDEAAELGLFGLGALASFAADLDIEALAGLFPERTEEVLLQADLTAVAPGPLTAEAARELGAMAVIESRGGATVYRFTPATLRQAMAGGFDSDRMLAVLKKRSRTPVPQPLAYLIADTARTMRETAAEVSADQSSSSGRRSGVPRSSRQTEAGPLDRPAASAVVASLRAEEESASRSGQRPQRADAAPVGPVDALREAAETGETVWVSATDATGRIVERLLTVAEVAAGAVDSVDARSGEPCRLPVRRIVAAHILRRR